MTLLMACGNDKATEEVVKLETFNDRLSYALGAEHARMLLESGDPNLARLKYDKIEEGFLEGVKTDNIYDKDCEQSIRKLYGAKGQDFDTTYLDAGCICTGKYLGSIFNKNWKKTDGWDKINTKLAAVGLRHALEKKDTLVKKEDRIEMINSFITDLNKKSGAKMMAKAKQLPNTKTLPNGIIIQTLQPGNGGSPTSTDDVTVDYIVTTPEGDTMDSSFGFRGRPAKPLSINLAGVIPGWTQGFPSLQKGGKYKMFIPGELAYGAQQGFQSLCFYIDFQNFGKAGSLAQPMPQQPQ